MKLHTQQFKEDIIKHGRQLDSIISYVENNEMIVLRDELNSITPHYESSILKSAMKSLEFDCRVTIPIGTVINFRQGLLVGNAYEYLNFGNYVVYKVEKQEDKKSYLITCYDKMLYSMIDYEPLEITYPITIRNYINVICNKLGLVFKNMNSTFANYDKQIQADLYEGLGYTYRDILDELAEVTGSTICIDEETDLLEVRYITDTHDTIDERYFKDTNVNFGEKYGPINSIVLSRSAESDNVYLSDDQSIEQNGLCEIKIKDNQIMNFNDRSDYLPDLLSTLGGLEYYLNDYVSKGILYYNLCDKYTAKIGENYYTCVMFNNETLINNGLEENVNTPLPEASETDYTKADKTDQRINQTYLIVDKQNQRIDSVIANVTEQNNKISQITQTVDEINSKISDIADITISGETTFASLELDNINESEPIMIKIRPTVNNISYIYPRNNLYPTATYQPATQGLVPSTLLTPSSSLVPNTERGAQDIVYMSNRIIRFHNETTNENIDYELPDDLLYYDSTHYDEFYLDYDSQTCQVTKRCKYNANMEVEPLSSEVINTYSYPSINLTDGDYIISLPSYEYGYLFTRLMIQNIYTTQFATKAEVNSQISQTTQSINLSVDQKLTNYSTTTQMNSAISLKANEITSSVSETYATKTTTNQLSSRITQNANAITSEVTRATGNENTLSSRISQTAKGISLSVNNGSTSSGITITTTKEDGTQTTSSGTITMNGLVKFTDLSTSGSTTINGSNITTGTISANRISGGTISGASFKVTGSNAITVYGNDNLKDAELNRYGLYVYNNSGNYSGKVTASNITYGSSSIRGISMVSEDGTKAVTVVDLGTQINGNLHVTGTITQGSLESMKKNIKKYDEDVLNKIVNSDIYKYNYKNENDNDKNHIGFIIGNKYNTPSEIVREDGIDLYSMTAMLWKAVQEQQVQINELKKEMEKIKNGNSRV